MMRSKLLASTLLVGSITFATAAQAEDKQDTPTDSANPTQIIVTATPFHSAIDQTPAIPAKVDSEEIRQAGGASIANALKDVPGISASGFAEGASRPIIRGMDANRVRLLEDGTSISDVSDIGPDHGTPIDPLSAQSIEVVRGAAALRYGSQAIGGVVNVLNDRVPMQRFSDPLSAEVNGSYATVNDAAETSGLVNAQAGDIALHADAYYRHTGDYDTPLGTQANSFFHGWGGALGGSYFIPDSNSHLGIAVTHYDAQYGIPSDTTYIDMRQTKIMTRDVIGLGGALKSLNIDGSYADYQHQEKNPDGSVNTTFKNKEYDLHSELLINPIGFISNLALGAEYQHRDFSAIGEDASYLSPATSDNIAGYLFSEIDVSPKFHLEASGRVENVHITGTPLSDVFSSRDYTPVSGALGALYTITPGVKFGLTGSTTGRAPALTELFARGGHDGPQTYETGDPDLKMERANSLELSLRINKGPFSFEGSLYSTWFNNYIYGDLTGRTCDDDGNCVVGDSEELREVFYRQQGAHFRGVEGQASLDLYNSERGTLKAHVLGDYTRATLDDGNNVPRIPPYRIGGGLDWKSKPLDAGFTLIHYGRQDDYGVFDTPTDSYNDLSAHITVRPFKAYPGIELSVVGDNLTDDVQRYATAFNKDLVMQPGRSVRFVLHVATF
ncbi:MAG: TonB-dependent receptor [Sphingomonadaceae bacterium]